MSFLIRLTAGALACCAVVAMVAAEAPPNSRPAPAAGQLVGTAVAPLPEAILLVPPEFNPSKTGKLTRIDVVDRKPGATHQVTFVTGDGDRDNAKFAIFGMDLLAGPFDFASQPPGTAYSIRVRAIDVAQPERFLDATLAPRLAEPNAPAAIRLDATSVSAFARSGALVARISVEDVDRDDTHTVELAGGPGDDDNARFVVSDSGLRLAQVWPPGQGVARVRLRATDRAGLQHEATFALPVSLPKLRLTEINATVVGGVRDERSSPQEWIELQNTLDQYVELEGWAMTDDRQQPDRWKFPRFTLGPGEYGVVLADGRGTAPVGSTLLHAGFSLSAGGEWVGLVEPDGTTVASALEFPRQFPGVAYGVGEDGRVGYLPVPTPRAANGPIAEAGENTVSFSRGHGFYTEAVQLELTATIPGSAIRYTLDGTVPAADRGTLYTGPILVNPNTTGTIRGTRLVRAIAVHPAAAYAPVGTQTYLFIEGVSGPSVDGVVSQSRLVSSIRQHAVYGPMLDNALRSLPALSLVTSGTPGTTERTASLELFDPENAEPGFQIDCGIEATGTTSLGSPKTSLAAHFRTRYGPGKLRYPVFARGSRFPMGANTEFNSLRIRSHSHDTFYWLGTRENPPVPYGSPSVTRSGDAQLARNPWIDEMQLAMGQPGKRGRQVHLFLNGSYHGIYHIHEHPDEHFMATHFPGPAGDYHFTSGATTGSDYGGGNSWRAAWSSLKASLNNYTQARRWIDVTNLCDYMVLNFYAGNDWDWSAQHNWRAAGPRFPDRGGWKFFQQDSDICLQDVAADCTDQDVPDGVFTALMRYADFRVLFRDRVYRHCFGDGMLTASRAASFYDGWMNEIGTAIVAETARWQPATSVATLPWDRDQEWANEWRYLRQTFFPQRIARLLPQLRRRSGWWPIDPPSFSVPAGVVPAGQSIALTTASGTVYFTTDGSDPRQPGGAVRSDARRGSFPINAPTLVRARTYTGSDWSALVEAYYLPEGTQKASAANLVLSEIQYHPVDDANAEFLEFLNTSSIGLDLSGVTISNAVTFRIPPATALPPGGRLVVAKDPAAFARRYGTPASPYYRAGSTALGPWTGSLSNGGETVDVLGEDGTPLFACTYGTRGDWPRRADGRGSSLELVHPELAPATMAGRTAWLSEPANWRPSLTFHGSPGSPGDGGEAKVAINEVLASPPAGQSDAIELLNVSGEVVDVSGWFLSDSSENYRKYRLAATLMAPGARLVLREADFNNPSHPSSLVPFALSDGGDDVWLVQATPSGDLLRFVDRVEFDPMPRGVSLGRFPDGTGPWVWLREPSLGAANGPPAAGYAAWSMTSFPSGIAPELRRPDADPDGDGQSNVAEYAFASSPGKSDPPPLAVRSTANPAGLELSYRERTDALDLSYTIEVSSDLRSWEPAGPDIVEAARTVQADGSTLVIARIATTGNDRSRIRFVRVRADLRFVGLPSSG